jgi:signal transduction histidine kinase
MGECRFVNDRFFALGKRFAAPSGKGYVVVAEAVFKPKELADLTRILLIVFGLSVALVAAGGWVFAGRALAPVSHIMNQVDALLPGDLGKRLETSNNHDELARLVFTFNKLLERIHRAFNSQKMFLSNVSHELKNPLTVIISQIEIALQKERDGEEYRQILQSVLEDARNINLMSDKLMQLAKINAGGEAIPMEPLRIDEVVWQAKEAVLKSNPDYRVHFEIRNLPDEEAKLSIRGNEQLLKTALINLMDNGCKFSADHRVNVQLSFDDSGKTAVEIRDEGAGIAAEDLPALFEPFYRSRHNGSIKGNGIGLSLVDSIVKLHRIDLKVERNQPKGAVFRMEFLAGTE